MGTIASFLRRLRGANGPAHDSALGFNAETVDLELCIPNMVCEGCAEKIEDALQALAGVRQVRPDVGRKLIRVSFESNRINAQQLKGALAAAGFTAAEAR